MLRHTWAEINLDNIDHNIREIRRITDEKAKICAVIKAEGYGHGAVHIAKEALKNGIDRFAVAILREGLKLRGAGIREPILILGLVPDKQLETAIMNNLTLTVYTLEGAKAVSKAAQNIEAQAKIHIKLDTGMGRLGFLPNDESISEILEIYKLPNIKVKGIYTHLANADKKDKTHTQQQLRIYHQICNQLTEKGVELPRKHVANSAAIIDLPETHLDIVRAGLIIYGMYPSDEVQKERISLKPAMTLKTRISHLKKLPPGHGISYGSIFTTTRDTVVATLPIGYADGYSRILADKGEVLVKGQRAPIIGKICMDQCMIDVTDIDDVSVQDEVVLFGQQGDSIISPEEVASLMGTINYEIVCMIGKRVPRVYIQDGEAKEAWFNGLQETVILEE
ncbi:MAG TPA: alanine racemase [Thermoanaerobacterales bacterium]|nr:alanine racemase [Thermoanaerobacterales bacterium]